MFALGMTELLERTLTVMIESEPGGTRVDLVGSTRARTIASIDETLVTEHDAGARTAGARL